MLVISTVYSFYTLDPRKRSQLRDMQLFASASLAVLSFLPIPIVLASVLVPSKHPVGQLGTKGGMRTNAALVLLTSSILALGASFRASVAFQLRPASRLAWFDSKSLLLLLHIRRGARRRLPVRPVPLRPKVPRSRRVPACPAAPPAQRAGKTPGTC